MTRPPTARQLSVLAAIAAQTRLRGICPSHLELAAAIRARSTFTVHGHISALLRLGLLEHKRSRKRALFVTPAGHAALAARRFQFIPIVRERGKARAA